MSLEVKPEVIDHPDSPVPTSPEAPKEDLNQSIQAMVRVEEGIKEKNPKGAERFKNTLEGLSGVSIQEGVLRVAKGDMLIELNTKEKSLQTELDFLVGELEARVAMGEEGLEKGLEAGVDIGPVDLRASVDQNAEGDKAYSASVRLPEGFKLWASNNEASLAAGAEYRWKQKGKGIGKAAFTFQRNEAGQVTLKGSMSTPQGTRIDVSSNDGETADVAVSQALDVGSGNLSLNAGASLVGDYQFGVKYTMKF